MKLKNVFRILTAYIFIAVILPISAKTMQTLDDESDYLPNNFTVVQIPERGDLSFEISKRDDSNMHVKINSYYQSGISYPEIIYLKIDNDIVIIDTFPLIPDCPGFTRFGSCDIEFDIPNIPDGDYNIYFQNFLQYGGCDGYLYNRHLYKDTYMSVTLPVFDDDDNILDDNYEWVYAHSSKPIAQEYLSYERIKRSTSRSDSESHIFDVLYSITGDFENDNLILGQLKYDDGSLYAVPAIETLPENYWQWGMTEYNIKEGNPGNEYLIYQAGHSNTYFMRDFGDNKFIEFHNIGGSISRESYGLTYSYGIEGHPVLWVNKLGYTGRLAASLIFPSRYMKINQQEYRQLLLVRNKNTGKLAYLNPEREEEYYEYAKIQSVGNAECKNIFINNTEIYAHVDTPSLIRLIDISGNEIRTAEGIGQISIDSTDLPKGFYIATLENRYGKWTKTILR